MKSAIAVLIAGLLASVTAFCGIYFFGTASYRDLLREQTPELAWLRKEFNFGDVELARITKLHDAYQPHCKEMCRRIDEQNEKLRRLLAGTNAVTPEIESALAENARLRAECQRDMLKHFYEVSQTMPPEQGRHYLSWIQKRTFTLAYGMAKGN